MAGETDAAGVGAQVAAGVGAADVGAQVAGAADVQVAGAAAAGAANEQGMGAQAAGATAWDADELAGAKLAFDVLGALFLSDPDEDRLGALLGALASADPVATAASWPFASAQADKVSESLTALGKGARRELAAAGVDIGGGIATAAGCTGAGPDSVSPTIVPTSPAAASSTAVPSASSSPPAAPNPLAKTPAPLPAAPTPLALTYRRLFVGPGHLAAPPWGSVYTDRDCVAFGTSTLALRGWMQAHGIHMDVGERVPEDHIGLLMGQASMLCEQGPGLLDEFLRLHVLTWSHHYLKQLAAAAVGPWDAPTPAETGWPRTASRFESPWAGDFYQALAVLADATLEGIRVARHLHVDYPVFYR